MPLYARQLRWCQYRGTTSKARLPLLLLLVLNGAEGMCRICNVRIMINVQQVICFAFHDSNVLLRTCAEAADNKIIVTLCYLD